MKLNTTPDPKAPRMSPETACITVRCLLDPDSDRPLTLECTSGVRGSPGEEWIEAQAMFGLGHYRWWFEYKGGMVTDLIMAKTPKGAEYHRDTDGGDALDDISIPDQVRLTRMLLKLDKAEGEGDWGVRLVQCWYVSVDGAQPYFGGQIIYDKELAEKALQEQREYRSKVVTDNLTRNKDAARELAEKSKPKKKK